MDKFSTFRYLSYDQVTIRFDVDLSDPEHRHINMHLAFCSWKDQPNRRDGRWAISDRLDPAVRDYTWSVMNVPFVNDIPLVNHLFAALALNPDKYRHIIERINRYHGPFRMPLPAPRE